MRHCIFLLVIIHISIGVACQTAINSKVVNKPVIDSAAIADWADLLESDPSISPNGKYFMYPIYNLPVGSKTLVIQSTDNLWKKEFVGAEKGFFSSNNKLAVFKNGDSLYIQALGKEKRLCIGNVASYKKPGNVAGQWLAFVTKTNELTVLNLVTEKRKQYQNIWEYQFDNKGQVLLVKEKIKKDTAIAESIKWLNLSNDKEYNVWQSTNTKLATASHYSFDEEGRQLVFMVQDKSKTDPVNTIWYYSEGKKATEKVTNTTKGIDSGMMVSSSAPNFNKNGRYIFFKTQRNPEPDLKAHSTGVQVDIWNHKDLVLQSLQSFFRNSNQELPQSYIKTQFVTSITVDNSEVKILENDSVRVAGNHNGESDFVITTLYENKGDKTWPSYQVKPYFITSLKDGRHQYLALGVNLNFWLSPNKKSLIYFDTEKRHYMSYDIINKVTINISQSIKVKLTDDVIDQIITPNPFPAGIAGWTQNGNLLIYDNWDIWALDLSGKEIPRNITNGYGRAHNIRFDLIPEKGTQSASAIFAVDKPVLLTALSEETKENSFFKVGINKKGTPELLSNHSSLIYATAKQSLGLGFTVSKVKADNADLWIVKEQTMSNAPNFYLTRDFKTFKQLTDMQPQKNYRWATSELTSWKMPSGKLCQGILYKPEGFDPQIRYPVIVYYYEKRTGGLNKFLRPGLIDGVLNIPWFVSRGYLVFTPDIHYTVGKVSQSIVNSIIPGIKELTKLPYIDSLSIGIQGHSFGGYETNVLITETDLFAAAVEGAGATDLISQYGSLLPTPRNHGSGIEHQERGGQHRMNGTMWQDREAYFENSPIFKADKVTTPLLIMHNKGDQAVPWGQAVELFIALRRLQKLVWMLQYDEGGHGVNDTKDQMDYTLRMTQFFDHYLKGAPAPSWMTKGIPAVMKGMMTGYELDPAGNCSSGEKRCKVCHKWNEQFKRTPSMFAERPSEWQVDKDLNNFRNNER